MLKILSRTAFERRWRWTDLAAAIAGRLAPFDPAVLLQPVEQAGQGRLFNSHPLGDFLLGELVSALRKVNERPPFALAQAERAQPLIELGAPGTGGAEEEQAEAR